MARVDDLTVPGELRTGAFARARQAALAVGMGLLSWSPVIVVLVAWELVSRSGLVTPFTLPALSSVLQRIMADIANGSLLVNASVTVYRSLAGFIIAGGLGIFIGLLIVRHRGARWFFDPLISVGFPMPKVAFLPIFILWLGFYDLSKITMIVFNTIFPVITATVVGIAGVEREIIWSARNLGTSERRLLWDILMPAALPAILTGLQVALPIALIVDIVTEMAMSGNGIGAAMQQASRFADSRGVFAGIVEIAVIGYVLVKGMAMLRRRLLLWHQEALEPTTV